jgi:RNA polymerase nonessential primary-like sigma factor
LVQAGLCGLWTTAQRFQPERGIKFIVYATFWIRQSVARLIMNNACTVRVPCNEQLARRKRRERQQPRVRSFDAPLRSDGEGIDTLHDVLAANAPQPTPDVAPLLDALSDRQRRVVALRFWGGETLDVVAQDIGVTRERARQIQNEALAHMRRRVGRAACAS